jgi:ADP-ribose pyrophosphatase YjhB (NUDIX family)
MTDDKPVQTIIAYCPRCGSDRFTQGAGGAFACSDCTLTLYLNTGAAVGAIITDRQGRILLIRRAKDPSKGKLGLPGGFLDLGETAEQAIVREVKEEVGLDITSLKFLASFPNDYHYRGIIYPLLDIFFTTSVESLDSARALDEVDACIVAAPEEIDLDTIAFPSIRKALELYMELLQERAD